MSRIRQQSIRGAFSLYLGQLLGIVNKLIFFPLVFLGNEKYWGLLAWFYSISFLLISLATWGFPRVLIRYLPVFKRESKQIIRFVLKFSITGLLILLFTLIVFGKQLTQFNQNPNLVQENYPILLLIVVSIWFFELGGAIFQARFKSSIPLFSNNVIIRISTTTLLVSMYFMEFSVTTFLWLQALSYFVIHGGLFLLALKNEKMFSSLDEEINPDLPKKEFKSFASFGVMNSLSSQGVMQLDAFLVGGMLPFAFSAILDALKNVTSVIEMPSRAIVQSSVPVLAERIHERDEKAILNIYYKTSMVQFTVSAILFVFIVLNADWIFGLVPTKGFDLIPSLVLITGIGKLVDSVTGANATIIGNSAHYRFNLYSSIALLVLLVILQSFLIPLYELKGAAIGMALGTIVINIVRSIYLYQKEGWHPFRKMHIYVVSFFMVCLGVVYWFKPSEFSWTVIVYNVILATLVVSFMLYLKPVDEIDLLVSKFFKKKKGIE